MLFMLSSKLPRPKHSPYYPPTIINDFKSLVSSSQSLTTSSRLILDSSGDIIGDAHPHQDTIPLKKRFPNLIHHFPREKLEDSPTLQATLEETKQLVNSILSPRTEKQDVTYVTHGTDKEPGRVIQIRTFQEDPMLPPKFKLRKNRHQQVQPQAPILKDTKEVQITKEERDKWRIPAALSNWKNNHGFTIALDKRVAANEGAVDRSVNVEKFASLTLALESAEKEARQELIERREEEERRVEEERRRRDMELRELSRVTRDDRKRRKRAN